MARETRITCDRCEQRITEGEERTLSMRWRKPPVEREFFVVKELCEGCAELFRSMTWEPASNGVLTVKRMEEYVREDQRLRADLRYIREILPDVLIAWGEGKDEEARELIRKAAARAASQT